MKTGVLIGAVLAAAVLFAGCAPKIRDVLERVAFTSSRVGLPPSA